MSNVSKLKKKAIDFEQKKQFDRAVQAYIELLDTLANDIDDVDIPLYNRVGDILIRQNNAAEALVYYERAVDLYSERGFLNNAIALCNKILRQSPGRSVIYYKLGKISATKGFKSDAKRNFLEYADRMEKSGKRDEAFRALKEFADLCPDQDDVRLMLAEHLARDNRREEAIDQLQTLHAKFETEGRSAEARATLDRMKAIDPDVEPRPSGAYQSVKSNELVFLDVDDVPSPRVQQTPAESIPAARAPQPEEEFDAAPEPAIDSPSTALDGLTLTFMPDAAASLASPTELLDGLTTTGDQTRITPGAVAPVEDLDTGRVEPTQVDVELPSLVDIPAVPDEDSSEWETARLEVESFADDTLSGREFAELELEPLDEPVEERPHDLALPSELPLMRFSGDEPRAEPQGSESSGRGPTEPEPIDLDAEITSPISRVPRPPARIDDQAFELTEEEDEADDVGYLNDAASALADETEPTAKAPNEPARAIVEQPTSREEPPAPEASTPVDTAEPPLARQPGGAHSLEWEDLAAAAATHDVEPMELPAGPTREVPEESVVEEQPDIDPNFLDLPPTFGIEETPPELSLSPLSPDTLEAIPEGDAQWSDASLDAEPLPNVESFAPDEERTERRTPPQALEAHALVDALRERAEASPNDPRLRRRLAEALLETGDREQGLRELDTAMQGVEQEGDLDTAREIATEILRLVPESVRHHQKCVEYAVRSGDRVSLIEAYVSLADALFRGGEHDKARAVYGRVVELEPNEARALAALDILVRSAIENASSEAPPAAAPSEADDASDNADATFANLELEDLDAEVAAAFQSQVENGDEYDGGAARDGVFQTPAFVSGGDFVDLGAMLRGDQPSKSTRMVVGDAKPTGDEQADFEDLLRRFKQGVAANVEDEDFDSHYDLGVAFKEMGLIDDAIAQFQKALRSDTHRSRAYEALGQCFVEKGQYKVAATLLARAVETTRVDDRVLVGSLYLLGYALEQLQREREALVYYHRVFAVDVDFRDVASRIRSLESHAPTK
jgi:tetratricopeptide (TPR) repeat protein